MGPGSVAGMQPGFSVEPGTLRLRRFSLYCAKASPFMPRLRLEYAPGPFLEYH